MTPGTAVARLRARVAGRRVVLVVLTILVVAGAVLRAHAAAHPSKYQSADEQDYARIARSLAVHDHYGDPGMTDPVHWPPGAPLLFAAAYKVHPQIRHHGVWDVPSAYPVQAAVGTLTILAAFVLTAMLAGDVAGLVAAGLVALYPPLVDASGDLLSEPLGSLLATAGVAATVWAMRAPTWRRGVLAGALLGATVLTRADLALVPFICLAAVALAGPRRREPHPRWRSGAALRAVASAGAPFLVGLVVLVAPWTIFASSTANAFVPLSDGGGSNLFVGTYLPGNGSMFGAKRLLAAETKARFPPLRRERPDQLPQSRVMAAVAARNPKLRPNASLQLEGKRNLRRYALHRPVDFAGMMLRKAWRLWGSYPLGTHHDTRAWIRALHLAITCAALGLLALALATRRRRSGELWLLATILLSVTAVNMVLISEARHNLAVMPIVIAAGTTGGAAVVRGLLGRRRASASSLPAAPAGAQPA